jgi:hypothetical protein
LLVYKDLSDLWRIAWEHRHQRMFGANLYHPVNDPNCLEIRETSETDKVKNGICRISGGVVLWNIKQIIEDCRRIGRNVFAHTIFLMNTTLRLPDSNYPYVFSSEEEVFTVYSYGTLQAIAPDTLFCFVPFSYNMAKLVLLQHFINISNDISIFHWDTMFKPWDLDNGNINEELHFCPRCIGIDIDYSCPLAKLNGDIAFVMRKGSEERRYFLSLFLDPEEGHTLLERHFPCLLEDSSEGKTSIAPSQEEILFLRQILLWKKTAARTEFYQD